MVSQTGRMDACDRLFRTCWKALGGDACQDGELTFSGEGSLESLFPVSDLAAASVGCAALSVSRLLRELHGRASRVCIDRRLSSFWFKWSIRPRGWTLPAPWDPIAGDYPCSDGWIRLHTNAPLHRAAAERVLGAHSDKEGMAQSVLRWRKSELEQAVVDAGGCAAEMRSADEWSRHLQGVAVASEPLFHREQRAANEVWAPRVLRGRPLAEIRVLDLTRVLAGPVATRFLAGYGAQVLRIDPPLWDEPGVVPEVNLGKRTARLDLATSTGRDQFLSLLEQADVLLHGYRPGALEGLGLGQGVRLGRSPDLIEVCLDAYGWSGPWSGRRGFDSLVQMSVGIAHAGMAHRAADRPVPLPVQALDHATGYLMAAAAIRGVQQRLNGKIEVSRLSLARTAKALMDAAPSGPSAEFAAETQLDCSPEFEQTSWGEAQRLIPPAKLEGTPMRWDLPAHALGADSPVWNHGLNARA